MFRAWNLLVLLWLALGCEKPGPPQIQAYFSPRGGCTEAVVRALNDAQKSVHVQAYSFTSAPIAKALVEAHRRKVQIHVILDDSQQGEKYSSADFLKNAGIEPRIDSRHGIAHNKVMIVDEQSVITGSFNFTKAAEERNAENLLVITDQRLARQYLDNWRAHAGHAERFVPSASRRAPSAREKDSPLEWETWKRFFEQFK